MDGLEKWIGYIVTWLASVVSFVFLIGRKTERIDNRLIAFERHEQQTAGYGLQLTNIERDIRESKNEFDKHQTANNNAFSRFDERMNKILDMFFDKSGKSIFITYKEFDDFKRELTTCQKHNLDLISKQIELLGDLVKSNYDKSVKERVSLRDDIAAMKSDFSVMKDRMCREK